MKWYSLFIFSSTVILHLMMELPGTGKAVQFQLISYLCTSKWTGKKGSDWIITMVSRRLPAGIKSACDKNLSWKTKQKSQRLTVLLPWSDYPQFPPLKPSLILIFPWGEVEGFYAYCFYRCCLVLIIIVIMYYYRQYAYFHLFIYSIIILLFILLYYLFIRLHHQNYITIIYLFLYLFPIECQATCFKNSSYIFSKRGRHWFKNWRICYYQGGDLVSIETEEEWQFISHEIKKRGTWNTNAWHIGLWKRGGVWIWKSGEQLNISKWRDSEPNGNDDCAEISRNGGLFSGIDPFDDKAYICEIPGGKIPF